MKRSFLKWIKAVIIGIPLIIGVFGFAVVEDESLLDALFYSVSMYVLGYQEEVPNSLVELARWTAPLVTASGAVWFISSLRNMLCNAVRYRRGDSVAVYGPRAEKEELLSELGRHGIDGGEQYVRAQRYVLLGNETDSFEFYDRYREELKNSTVYDRNFWTVRRGCLCFAGSRRRRSRIVFSVISFWDGQKKSIFDMRIFTAAYRKMMRKKKKNGGPWMHLPVIPMSVRQIIMRFS